MSTKSNHTVVAILAVCMAGAAYVPIDPQLPESRRRMLLEDAAPRLVLGRSDLRGKAHGLPYLALDGPSLPVATQHLALRLPTVLADAAAYIMYTSGSTGRPKGVVIEHGALESFFRAHNARVGIGPGHRCMNTGAFHFDVSLLDVFLPLHFGASVIITPELPLPALMLHIIEKQRITHFYAVGTVLALITGDGTSLDSYDLSSLRVLQTGAEVCSPRVVNRWLSQLPDLRFLNSYGPTEASVGCVSYAKLEPGPVPNCDVPIGEVHEGCEALLVDDAGQPVLGDHVRGELLIAGPQLMRGYWKRPEEQAEAFVYRDGVRYYRTGDQVYRDAQGLLHYVGRRDQQWKVGGCRVDLSELQRALEQHAEVVSALVGAWRDGSGRVCLGAALVMRGPMQHSVMAEIHALLVRELPAPLLPRGLWCARELPRSSSGKGDVAACMALLEQATKRHPLCQFFISRDETALVPVEPARVSAGRAVEMRT